MPVVAGCLVSFLISSQYMSSRKTVWEKQIGIDFTMKYQPKIMTLEKDGQLYNSSLPTRLFLPNHFWRKI